MSPGECGPRDSTKENRETRDRPIRRAAAVLGVAARVRDRQLVCACHQPLNDHEVGCTRFQGGAGARRIKGLPVIGEARRGAERAERVAGRAVVLRVEGHSQERGVGPTVDVQAKRVQHVALPVGAGREGLADLVASGDQRIQGVQALPGVADLHLDLLVRQKRRAGDHDLEEGSRTGPAGRGKLQGTVINRPANSPGVLGAVKRRIYIDGA